MDRDNWNFIINDVQPNALMQRVSNSISIYGSWCEHWIKHLCDIKEILSRVMNTGLVVYK
jgi:hypothetical protein